MIIKTKLIIINIIEDYEDRSELFEKESINFMLNKSLVNPNKNYEDDKDN